MRAAAGRGAGRGGWRAHDHRRHRHGQVSAGCCEALEACDGRPVVRAGRAVRRGERLPGVPRSRAPAARAGARHPEAMGQALLGDPGQRSRRSCCRWRPCSPTSSRWTCPAPPRSTSSTRSTAPTGWPTPSCGWWTRRMPGPLVLVAEEAHWADGASARLLDRLAAASAGRPWAVDRGATGRGGRLRPGWRYPRRRWSRCRPTSSSGWSSPRPRPRPLRPHEIAAVVDRAQGNPLFVEEVTRVGLDAGSLDALPESVQAAMSAQIDLLPPGRPADPALLRGAWPQLPGRGAAPDAGRRTGWLSRRRSWAASARSSSRTAPTGWRFRNSLVRDAAYEGLAYKIRGRLHRAAGETLEAMSTDLDADSPDPGPALLASRRRRPHLDVRADGRASWPGARTPTSTPPSCTSVHSTSAAECPT